MLHFLLRKDKSTRIFYTFVTKKDMNIIIIGATSGIGYGLLKKYAVLGNTIGILGRRRTILKELEESYPSKVITCAADISRQEEMSKAVRCFQS